MKMKPDITTLCMGGIILFRIVHDIFWNCLLFPKMKLPPISMMTLVARLSCIIILALIMIVDGARLSAEGTCSIVYDTIVDPISTVSSYFTQGPSTHPRPYPPQGNGVPGRHDGTNKSKHSRSQKTPFRASCTQKSP